MLAVFKRNSKEEIEEMGKVLCSQAGDCCNAPAGLLQASIPSISWKDILECWKISWISLTILFPGKHLGRAAVK